MSEHLCLFLFQSLVMNSAARRTCTVGEIVNLVSADTQKLMDFVVYFNAVWLAPIEVTLCLFFLWQVRASLDYNKLHSYRTKRNLILLTFSAFGTIGSSRHHHRHLHLPSERIHRE